MISLTSWKAWRFSDILAARRFLNDDLKSELTSETGMIEMDIRLANGTRFDASFHETGTALCFLNHVAK